ncbi:hypothetical protein NXS19_009719 [Fusarium pseudograminearum]|nr:hypothetical protein NXS19_009719 [Fusarium pseudograminearum]
MVAIRSFVVLYAAVGIASAGKCKPESISSSILSETSISGSVGFSSASTAESSTTVPGTTLETSISESTAETVSSAISTDTTETTTLESSLTTLLTSFVTTSAVITTVESAATTTSAAPIPSCPSDTEQCFGTMEIKCDSIFGGLSDNTEVKDLNECVKKCSSDTNCAAFSYAESIRTCFTTSSLPSNSDEAVLSDWISGKRERVDKVPQVLPSHPPRKPPRVQRLRVQPQWPTLSVLHALTALEFSATPVSTV